MGGSCLRGLPRLIPINVKCLTARNSSWSAGPIPKAPGPGSGTLLLAYYYPGGRLVYAGRVGTGIDHVELEQLWRRLQPLAMSKMPLDALPPRTSRFGAPLVLSHTHWVWANIS